MLDRILILYSIFDQSIGPIVKVSFPKINNKRFGSEIAQKSIDFLSAEETSNHKSLAFLPFPSEKKKGVIRLVEWRDETLRGNIGTGALTLIFDEDDDVIFYKYIKDLEIEFDEAAKKIIAGTANKVV